MKLNLDATLKTITGAIFALPPLEDGGAPRALRLGDILIEAALAVPMRETNQGVAPISRTAKQMVAVNMLAQRIYTAMISKEEITLSTDDIITLKTNLPLLEQQKGFSVSAIAGALIEITPDDFQS